MQRISAGQEAAGTLFAPPAHAPAHAPAAVAGTTSQIAGAVAARASASRRVTILQLLETHGPQTLFELATRMNVLDHQISGRITDLLFDGLIERTGDRRTKPETGCPCDVYRIGRSVCGRLPGADTWHAISSTASITPRRMMPAASPTH
jgi:hypothetical protein